MSKSSRRAAMYTQQPAQVQVRVDLERAGRLESLRPMEAMRSNVERFAQARGLEIGGLPGIPGQPTTRRSQYGMASDRGRPRS